MKNALIAFSVFAAFSVTAPTGVYACGGEGEKAACNGSACSEKGHTCACKKDASGSAGSCSCKMNKEKKT